MKYFAKATALMCAFWTSKCLCWLVAGMLVESKITNPPPAMTVASVEREIAQITTKKRVRNALINIGVLESCVAGRVWTVKEAYARLRRQNACRSKELPQ